MKAVELLQFYESGRRDFRGENLRGQNFKGKNLAGSDFSGADIRSTNFTNADLTKANFTQAKAGLQRRWAVGLTLLAFFLSGCSVLFSGFIGHWVALIFDFSSLEEQVAGWVALTAIVIFSILLVRQGLVAIAIAIAIAMTMAVAIAVVGSGSGALPGAIAMAIAVATALVIAIAMVLIIAIAIAGALAGVGVGAMAIAGATTIIGAKAGIVAFALTLVSAYISWRALKGDERDAWIRSSAIAFAAIGGTSFRGATLTDAGFSQARLKSTDLRRAMLLRTCWRDAEKLDRVRPGETYLNHAEVRQLVLTGEGQGQSYANLLNLTGINLQGANLVQADFTGSNLKDGNLQGATLANASFISANLNCANLQDTDLSNAKLVQAQLDYADLTGATLTGAYIEDWGITTRTQLDGIRCEYVFMRLPREGSTDPNPHRKPDNWKRNFTEGEFSNFIAPMVETLDLYHNQVLDPRAMAIAFSELRKQNPDAELEIISTEKRGRSLDKFNLKVRTHSQADRSQLHHQYFERYEHLLTLPPQALIELLMEKEGKAQMFAGMIGTAISKPKTQIDNYHSQGNTTMSQSNSGAPKYDLRNAKFSGGFAETVKGDQVGGNQYNYATLEKQSLADSALEIQRLLKQLEETNPTATEAEQKAFVTAAIPPTLRQRAIGALQSGGRAAVEELLDNPYVNVAIAVIEGWQGDE